MLTLGAFDHSKPLKRRYRQIYDEVRRMRSGVPHRVGKLKASSLELIPPAGRKSLPR